LEFEGRNIAVTGASGGIGNAISAALVADGANILMIDLNAPDILPSGAGSAQFAKGDITDWAFVKATLEGFAGLDGLVNAAGVLWFGKDKGVAEIDLDLWDQVMDINLKSMVHTAKAALPIMKEKGGSAIVNFGTIQSLRGDKMPQDAYQASKAGVIALTKSIAIQYAEFGIRANCILPGPTESPMQQRWKENPDMKSGTANFIPLGRVGTVEDMANACLFLLSDKASFITGTELIVDGGLTALP
jgi:NAD(P)-dependent dehydrogenase (short-subunit alcohol dehydrogenase family)